MAGGFTGRRRRSERDRKRVSIDYGAAEPLFERAVAINEKALDPDHPRVAASLENLAAVLRRTRREDEAAELERRASALRNKRR